MFPGSLVSLLIALVVIGICLYLVELIPMDATIKQLIRIVVIVAVVLWLISALFGGATGFNLGHLGRCP